MKKICLKTYILKVQSKEFNEVLFLYKQKKFKL
jgi:hypothetical protein